MSFTFRLLLLEILFLWYALTVLYSLHFFFFLTFFLLLLGVDLSSAN